MCWRLNKAAREQCQGRTKPLTRLYSFLWEFKGFLAKRENVSVVLTPVLP